MLVLHSGKTGGEFAGAYELLLAGTLEGKPWTQAMPGGRKPLAFKQYLRVEGSIEHPTQAVLKTVQVKVVDRQGAVKAAQTLRL
jgi:hypothetical protein